MEPVADGRDAYGLSGGKPGEMSPPTNVASYFILTFFG